MKNILSIPVREALHVEETDDGCLLITQTSQLGEDSKVLLCMENAHALSVAIDAWLAERQ